MERHLIPNRRKKTADGPDLSAMLSDAMWFDIFDCLQVPGRAYAHKDLDIVKPTCAILPNHGRVVWFIRDMARFSRVSRRCHAIALAYPPWNTVVVMHRMMRPNGDGLHIARAMLFQRIAKIANNELKYVRIAWSTATVIHSSPRHTMLSAEERGAVLAAPHKSTKQTSKLLLKILAHLGRIEASLH